MGQKLILIPAYGRNVDSLDELREMWESGKDFKMYQKGRFLTYCSIRDFDMLRKDFDIITLNSANEKCTFEFAIFTHLLAGCTTYV